MTVTTFDVPLKGYIGLYWGYIGIWKINGNYYSIMGLYGLYTVLKIMTVARIAMRTTGIPVNL